MSLYIFPLILLLFIIDKEKPIFLFLNINAEDFRFIVSP